MQTLLAFDVGNTNIVLGVFKGGALYRSWRMETASHKSADEYAMLVEQLFAHDGLSTKEVDDVIISTVVPSILYTLQHLSRKYFGKRAIVVGPGIKTGLTVKYDNPKQVGSDRIVNCVGALSKYGGPLIVIDLGTATTFCAVTGKCEYLGGTIAPGIKISSDALFEKTAKLPRVELEEPGHTICRNTIESMQSGLVYGHMGMVAYITEKMKTELAEYMLGSEEHDAEELNKVKSEIKVIATGGIASLLASGVKSITIVDKLLTLDGLSILYEKNKKFLKDRTISGDNEEYRLEHC